MVVWLCAPLTRELLHLLCLRPFDPLNPRQRNYDVFNCLELMDNPVFLDELKFGRGDGTLHYYLYNFRARPVDGGKMGLVLL